MTGRAVTVRVPATTANLGPGFDAVGLAVGIFATIRVALDQSPPPRGGGDPMQRMTMGALRAAYQRAGAPPPTDAEIDIDSDIPLGRGLGASAAARAAGIVAANALLGGPLSDADRLDVGTEQEGHADNVAPALFGGLQITALEGSRVVRVAVTIAPGIRCVGFVPDFSMPTHETRTLLPEQLSREDAVFNSSRAALLVAALATGEFGALRVATQERLHQAPRSALFPQLFDFLKAALDAGAFGAYLSGGGSTVMALSDEAHAVAARDAFLDAAARFEVAGVPFITDPCPTGATVLPEAGQ